MGTRISILKAALVILAITNLKSLPLMYHVRFYWQLISHFYLKKKEKPKSLFQTRNFTTFTPLMEMDFNFHKSNSTYFMDLDIARTDLMLHLFRKFYKDYKGEVRAYSPLGSVGCIFKREIPGYTRYNIKSRVIGWTDKWIFVLSRFETLDGKLYTVGLSKYVFKTGRKTVPVEEVFDFCGFKVGDEKFVKDEVAAQKWLELEADILEAPITLA